MALKKRSECTPEEALNYLQHFFATVDLMNEALSKFETLAATAKSVSERSRFRAKALEAERDLELLRNRRRAFLAEQVAVRPPTDAAVKKAEELTAQLAKVAAKAAMANTIITLATDGLDAFNKLHV